MRARVLLVLCGWMLSGCTFSESEGQVKDLRILAARAEPPEVLYNFLHLIPAEQRAGFPLGPYPMAVTVLAVDPQGRQVEVSARLCPEQTDDTCPGYVVRDDAPPAQIASVVPLVQPRIDSAHAELGLSGEVALDPFKFTFDDRAIDYMLPHDPNGQLDLTAIFFPTMPSFIVRAHTTDGAPQEEIAVKRFMMEMDISSAATPEIRQTMEDLFENALGLQYCPPETDPLDDVQCIKPREANRNPTITRVLYRRSGETVFKDYAGRLLLEPGQSLTLRPILADGDRQPYQAFQLNSQTGKISLLNHVEDPVFLWQTTVGSMRRQSSGEENFERGGGRGPPGFGDNEQEDCTTVEVCEDMPPDVDYAASWDAPDGPSTVWVVVQDQRGGVDWRRVDFEIKGAQTGGGGPFGGGGPGGGGP